MVALSIVFAILLFLTIDMIVQRRQLRRAHRGSRASRSVPPHAAPLRPLTSIPEGVALSPDHAWVRPEAGGRWCVGGDPLLCTLLGTPDFVELAPPGTWIRRGDSLATLQRGPRRLHVRSPVNGVVAASNLDAAEAPQSVQSDPYGTGWLCSVEPRAGESDRARLLHGDAAREFISCDVQRLRDILTELSENPAVGAAMADGGPPAAEVVSELNDTAWKRLVDAILHRDGRGTR